MSDLWSHGSLSCRWNLKTWFRAMVIAEGIAALVAHYKAEMCGEAETSIIKETD